MSRGGSVAEPVAALARAGVSSYSTTDASPNGLTLLFFDTPDQDLYQLVNTLSHGGQDRVLAVRMPSPTADASRCEWELLRAGATDVVRWEGAPSAEHIAQRLVRWAEVERLMSSPVVTAHLVGCSPAWKRTLRQLIEAARFSDSSILITGETGTGKELAAKLIHTLDPRPQKGELVVLDCATVVESLSGSEFFGHERGAFTGASARRDGVLSVADGGTLFLDELGELPLSLQAQLLRAIQEGAYKPVGSNDWKRTNFRLVCATNRDLESELERGSFRRDLFHRVACWCIRLPSLSERRSDILPLFRHFAAQCGHPDIELDDAVSEHIQCREYSGNIRELRRLAEQICHRHCGVGPVTVGSIPRNPDDADNWREAGFSSSVQKAVTMQVGLKHLRKEMEDAAVDYALELCEGSVQQAAQKLDLTPRALQLRMAGRRQEANAVPVELPDSQTVGAKSTSAVQDLVLSAAKQASQATRDRRL